jgi:hypothetical protein
MKGSRIDLISMHVGSGARLQHSVGQIIRTVLATLSQRVTAKTAAVVAAEVLNRSQQPQRTPSIAEGYGATPAYRTAQNSIASSMEAKSPSSTTYPPPEAQAMPVAQNPYPSPMVSSPSQYPVYTDSQPTADAPYQSSSYAQVPYSNASAEQVPVHVSIPTTHGGPVYVPSNAMPYYTNPPANEWMRWSQATLNAFPQAIPPEYMTSTTATTLMNLSGRSPSIQNGAPGSHDPSSQWPMNVFNIGPHGGNQVG